jgi:hypothetical protein
MYCELLVLGLALRQPHVVVSHEPLPQPSTPTAQKMYELDIRMFKAGGVGWWWGVGGGQPSAFSVFACRGGAVGCPAIGTVRNFWGSAWWW